MKKTSIVCSEKFHDIMASKDRLFVFKVFMPIEVTHDVVTIVRMVVGTTRDTKSAVVRGIFGAQLLGGLGAYIGVTSAKHKTLYQYRITIQYQGRFPELIVTTNDRRLITWLDSRLEGE